MASRDMEYTRPPIQVSQVTSKSTSLTAMDTTEPFFPALYSYFPVSLQELKKPKAKMYEAGLVLAVKIQETVTNILKW